MLSELNRVFATFTKRHKLLITLGVVTYASLSAIVFLMSVLIDALTNAQFEEFVHIIIITIVLSVFAFFIDIVNNYYWKNAVYSGIVHLRSVVLKGVLRKKPSYFMTNNSGEIMSKIMNDVVVAGQYVAITKPMLYINVSRIVLIFIGLFYLSWSLALVVVVFIPIYYLLFNRLNNGIRTSSERERGGFAAIQTVVSEILAAIDTIKIHRKEDYIKNQADATMQNYLNEAKTLNKYRSIGSGLTELSSLFLPIFLFLAGVYMVYNGHLTIGALVSFYAFLPFLTEPLNNLSDYYLGIQETIGMSKRVLEYLKDDDEMTGTVPISSITKINFSNLGFKYSEELGDVLNNINMELVSGDRVAILGKSGVGKSTLLKLITRFLDPTQGNITIDGVNIQDIDVTSYYNKIALLPQSPFLFSDTVLNNITFGDDYDKEAVQAVLEQANVSSLLERFSEGLDYKIKEVGKNLSGGEQQRLCLARALIRKADLLLMDEPTSALDENNERMLVEHLSHYLSQRDCIFAVVTHRKEILNICNKAVFFKGTIAHYFDLTDQSQRDTLLLWMENE